MINVAFDPAVAGRLHRIRQLGTDAYLSSEGILCIAFELDIGELRDGLGSDERITLPDRLIALWFDETDNWDLRKEGEFYLKQLQTLRQRLEKRESVRLWYSDAPRELCGFYHLCSVLQQYDAAVTTVSGRIPDIWGAIDSCGEADWRPYERALKKEEMHLYAAHWAQLERENAPLRAVRSGRPVSVGSDFYDPVLLACMPDTPIREAELVEKTIKKLGITLNVSYLLLRIRALIDQGILTVAAPAKGRTIDRMLQKT